jgi:hypothetical protein
MALHMRWVGRVWKTIGVTAEDIRVGDGKERDYLKKVLERSLGPGAILPLERQFRPVTTDATVITRYAGADP